MIKSKFIKENDILIEKPEFLKRISSLYPCLYISVCKEIIPVKIEDINEFFLNDSMTLINCSLKIKNERVYRDLTENYFYHPVDKKIELSYGYSVVQYKLREPIINVDKFEISSIKDDEITLNLLFDNTALSEWYKNYN
ncbi:hypothetical protein [Fusobacterium sp.]|uniref:hypothetical protein n=1 Tax=Fusobacterium sp. TaxID=68766 RepID=UPI000E9DC026|nr:hypothetical protein [Fusobacterium sp.]HBJ80158.1 hypothetical protein [Fusobacterium sp.]